MKIGSIVETVVDFGAERRIYGLAYPKKGDVLTVSSITKHPNNDVSNRGIVLLHFEEISNLIGVCDKKVDNTPNFVELASLDDIQELFKVSSNQEYGIGHQRTVFS